MCRVNSQVLGTQILRGRKREGERKEEKTDTGQKASSDLLLLSKYTREMFSNRCTRIEANLEEE